AYLQGDETKYLAYQLDKLALIPAAGGQARLLSASLDRAVSGPLVWSADSASVTAVVPDDRSMFAGTFSVTGRDEVAHVTSGKRTVSALFRRPAGGFAVLASTSTQLNEVHALEGG